VGCGGILPRNPLQKRVISFVVAKSSFLVPVAFHQLEDVPFAIRKNTIRNPGITSPRSMMGSGSNPSARSAAIAKLEARYLKRQVLKADDLFATVCVYGLSRIGWEELQPNGTRLQHDVFIRLAGFDGSRALKAEMPAWIKTPLALRDRGNS
jgi:hypothetical protein